MRRTRPARSAARSMRSVDVHTHLLPPELPRWSERFGYGGFIRLERVDACSARMVRDDGAGFRDVGHNLWDPDVRLRECDEAGVGAQVLSTVPVMFSYWVDDAAHALEIARFLNDHLASVCARNPRRFVGLGTLPLQAPDLAARELTRCVRELGLLGAQIGTHAGAWNFGRPELFPVFETAARLGAALFVHPWDMMGQERMQKYWLPWLVGMPAEVSQAICSLIFGGVFERLPSLRICFAHGGGAFAFTLGRIQHGFEARPGLVALDNPHPPSRYPEGMDLSFTGHSLGLQPRRAREYVDAELDSWARYGVDGHFEGPHPWMPYHEELAAPTARLVGARPHEVVVMNTLTVNLHL